MTVINIISNYIDPMTAAVIFLGALIAIPYTLLKIKHEWLKIKQLEKEQSKESE